MTVLWLGLVELCVLVSLDPRDALTLVVKLSVGELGTSMMDCLSIAGFAAAAALSWLAAAALVSSRAWMQDSMAFGGNR